MFADHTIAFDVLTLGAFIVFILAYVPIRSVRPLIALGLALLAAAFLFGCASYQPQPVSVRTSTAILVSQAIQFGVKDASKASIASEFRGGADVLQAATTGSIPTPETFQSLLTAKLPENQTKALVIADLTDLYRDQYNGVQLPQTEGSQTLLSNIQQVALGIEDGTAPFVTAP